MKNNGEKITGAAVQLSLCMIVKDEAFFLQRHLPKLRPFMDEIILVDTGSSDRSVEIASKYADRVLHFSWVEDFSKARNVSLQAASGTWILVLDADEIITAEDLSKLRNFISTSNDEACTLPRYNYSDNSPEPGWQRAEDPAMPTMGFEGYTTHNIVRLVRNSRGWMYRGKVHELLASTNPGSRSCRLDIPIHHYEEGNPQRPRLARRREYLRLLEAEIAADPRGDILELAGRTYMYHEQQFDRAVACFRKCLAVGYEAERNTQNLAEALYRSGKTEEAKNLYEHLLKRGSSNFAICLNLANLRARTGQSSQALDCLRMALAFCEPGTAAYQNIKNNISHLEANL